MYALYKNNRLDGNINHFQFIRQISLFGCKKGFIPWLLKLQTRSNQIEPYCWHLDVQNSLHVNGYQDSALIIDLKPKQHATNVSLYQVLDVWGYSSKGWTPIMLHLCGLFVDADPSSIDRNDFTVCDDEICQPIYEFLYIVGSIENGKLTGRWNAPPASPTNAALLWPDTLSYFMACIKKRTPNVFK